MVYQVPNACLKVVESVLLSGFDSAARCNICGGEKGGANLGPVNNATAFSDEPLHERLEM